VPFPLCPPLRPPAGLFDYLQRWHPGSTVVGFLGGPAGVMKNQFKLLTEQELVSHSACIGCLASCLAVCLPGWEAGEAWTHGGRPGLQPASPQRFPS
jgi:hypothetical protein